MKLTPLQKARRNYILKMRLWLGLCRNCGNDAPNGFLCEKCNDRKIEKQQEKRALRKKRGVCSCGAELAEEKKRCEKCYQRKRKANELLSYGEVRVCQTEGCDNIPAYKTPYCIDCAAKLRSSKVFFNKCDMCGEFFTTPFPNKRRCSPECIKEHWRLIGKEKYIPTFNPIYKRRCDWCGDDFRTNRPNTIYCCCVCRYKSQRFNNKKYNTKLNLNKIFFRDKGRCHICNRKLNLDRCVPEKRAATIDHVVPRSLGGVDEYHNAKLACFICNSTKGNKTIDGGEQLLLFGV